MGRGVLCCFGVCVWNCVWVLLCAWGCGVCAWALGGLASSDCSPTPVCFRFSGTDVVSACSILINIRRNVLPDLPAADLQALDVEHGIPPPRAAPSLLRRVVLSNFTSHLIIL